VIKIDWKASGVFSLKRDQSAPLLTEASSVSLKAAMNEWATGKGETFSTLGDRLKPSAFSVYGFTKRTSKYRKQQIRAFGQAVPYRSPRKLDFSQLAVAAIRMKGQAVIAALARINKSEHMYKLVTRPGGFTLISNKGGKSAKVTIRYPGAKALNIGGAKNAIYRKEFADWSMGGGRDGAAVLDRAGKLFAVHFQRGLSLVQDRKIV